jgi:hypothetical protein
MTRISRTNSIHSSIGSPAQPKGKLNKQHAIAPRTSNDIKNRKPSKRQFEDAESPDGKSPSNHNNASNINQQPTPNSSVSCSVSSHQSVIAEANEEADSASHRSKSETSQKHTTDNTKFKQRSLTKSPTKVKKSFTRKMSMKKNKPSETKLSQKQILKDRDQSSETKEKREKKGAGKRKVPTIRVNADEEESFDFNENLAVRAFRGQLGDWLQDEFDEIMKLVQERAGAARYGKERGSPSSSRNANGASSRRDGDHAEDDQEKESGSNKKRTDQNDRQSSQAPDSSKSLTDSLQSSEQQSQESISIQSSAGGDQQHDRAGIQAQTLSVSREPSPRISNRGSRQASRQRAKQKQGESS